MPEPRFRPCRQNQPMPLPPDVSDLIPENAMARLVDAIVERMDRRLLESLYPGGGAPAHDPSMMLKVVLFCYASGIYSSRKIAAATRENVNLMWLTGMSPLDHSTVNRFRSERVRPVFEDVFSEVVAVLAEAGHITLDTYFLAESRKAGARFIHRVNRPFLFPRRARQPRDSGHGRGLHQNRF